MTSRNWSLTIAWCLILGQAGCHLHQQTDDPLRKVVSKSGTPAPLFPLPSLVSRPSYDDRSSYGTMEIQPGDALPMADARAISPAEALKRSALMQEQPGQMDSGPALAIETHISHAIQPVDARGPEIVSGVETALNTARIEPATQHFTTVLSAAPAPAPAAALPVTHQVMPQPAPAPIEPQVPARFPSLATEANTMAPQSPPMPVQPSAPSTVATPQPAAAPPPSAQPGNSARTLLSTTLMTLNYRVGKIGPSGLGKVEVWATNDQGNTWQRLCEDLDRRSPSEIQLPGEGQWGLRLVAANGNGFGGAAPKRGDQPGFLVEVDTTRPRVQLNGIEPADGQSLDIRWTAQDANLGSAPVTISYRTQTDQPWQTVAANVQNTGSYRWQFPREHAQFYVRLQVSDEAGNSVTTESPTAVAVDVTVPQLVVVGISGVAKR